jgi:chemotaxis signal transduction protein
MDSSPSTDKVLRLRAEKYAKRLRMRVDPEEKVSITMLSAGGERFGIPTHALSCIVKTPILATMPNLPPWFLGLAQIRGELVGIIDLATWFGTPAKSSRAFMAVVTGEPGKLGILVDSVAGFREVGESDLAESFGDLTATGHPIRATTKDVVAILDVDKLFENPDMRIDLRLVAKPSEPDDRDASGNREE